MVMLRFFSPTPWCFLPFLLPLLLFAFNLPCRLAAAALSGMVYSDLLLLLGREAPEGRGSDTVLKVVTRAASYSLQIY
jgi:hypothetical protein